MTHNAIESMKLLEITKGRAETKFMYGGCGSFALALQAIIGGDIYLICEKEKPEHAFVQLDGECYDVHGQRGWVQMALSIWGRVTGISKKGPVTREQIPFKITDKDIITATEYIKANPRLFKLK
jgi:hypothetical protein